MTVENLVVLINGAPTSGKTETARILCPPAKFNTFDDDNISWDHFIFAAPLKDIFTTKTQIKGQDAFQRQLWMIDQALREMCGLGILDYDEYVELVYALAELNIESERSFCLEAGALINEACKNHPFAQRVHRQVKLHQAQIESEAFSSPEPYWVVSVISDLRREEEYELFKDFNTLKVRLDVSERVQKSRILEREDRLPSPEELSHPFMQSPFSDEFFDLIIDTDELSIPDQAAIIKKTIYQTLGVNQYAQSQSL